MGTTGSDSEVVVPVRGRVAALVGAVAALGLLASCTGSAPAPPAKPLRPAPLPSVAGANALDCDATLARTAGEQSSLEVGRVDFTSITTAGDGRGDPVHGAVPVEDVEAYPYFAKVPLELPDVEWVMVEIAPSTVDGWTAWVPAGVWTSRSTGWRLDDYVASAVVIDLDQCGSALGVRTLLGGVVLERPGCVDVIVRTSAEPQPERRTINFADESCCGA